jgi:hypothetical protein
MNAFEEHAYACISKSCMHKELCMHMHALGNCTCICMQLGNMYAFYNAYK